MSYAIEVLKSFTEKDFKEMQFHNHKFNELKKRLDKYIEDKFGCHYSDYDDDWLIDTIDYGLAEGSLAEVEKHMKEQIKEKGVRK